MTYAIYVAAVVVIGLLMGLVVLSIFWLRRTVTGSIRNKTLGLISVYDELLEKKSQSLKSLESEKGEVKGGKYPIADNRDSSRLQDAKTLGASEFLNILGHYGSTAYRDGSFGDTYLKIKENFSFNMDELLQRLSYTANEAKEGSAEKLLRELEFDIVYRLSTMEPKEQEQILRDFLPADGLELLDEYMKTHDSFRVLDFYDYIRFRADLESKGCALYVPVNINSGQMKWGRVTIIPDAGICEGYQLEENRILYDYCIRAKELS